MSHEKVTSGTSGMSSGDKVFGSPERSRLVTIVAHVDHGKTTLADSLIESNGLISERLAGTLRYLDSDPEERRRGITMRTSAIALRHRVSRGSVGDAVVHVLDSPGHADFCAEVSSALMACDGALVVVDAVEGMGPRSHQVIREAYLGRLVPVLVLNKVDRLHSELRLCPLEAHQRLRALVESVNAAAAAVIASARAAIDNQNSLTDQTTDQAKYQHADHDYRQMEENIWTFDPASGRGNVVFCSALFGWGFTLQSLTRSLFRNKIVSIKPLVLQQYAFGDYKLSDDGSKVLKSTKKTSATPTGTTWSTSSMPIFAKYGLAPIWAIHEGVARAAAAVGMSTSSSCGSGGNKGDGSDPSPHNGSKIRADSPGMDQVLEAFQVGNTSSTTTATPITSTEDLQMVFTRTGSSTEEAVLRCILRRYRPLADCVLNAVFDVCPSPRAAVTSFLRSQTLMLQDYPLDINGTNDSTESIIRQKYLLIHNDVATCRVDYDDPNASDISTSSATNTTSTTSFAHNNSVATVACICKFVATSPVHIRDAGLSLSTVPSSTSTSKTVVLLGVARVLSGRLRTGSEYYLMGPNFNPSSPSTTPKTTTIRLYLMMGSSFLHVSDVPAGHICAIYYDMNFPNDYSHDNHLNNLDNQQSSSNDHGSDTVITLCDRPHAMPVRGATNRRRVRPLVRVNIEPENVDDVPALERGLAKLAIVDPSVEVSRTARGERVLACLGELHLEQSVLDLERTYCESDSIQIRTSDPIVDFAETTTWFDDTDNGGDETDYVAFLRHETLPALRQTTIPPYSEEEGIQHATRGRTRAFLSGRTAALWVRVLPLAESIYQLLLPESKLKEKESLVLDNETSNELQKLGKALNCSGSSTCSNDHESYSQVVLQCLRSAVCTVGTNGNVIIESTGVSNGSLVRGVDADEIYVPPIMEGGRREKIGGTVSMQTFDATAVKTSPIPGKAEYESLRQQLKESSSIGLTAATKYQHNDADAAAWNIWKSDMNGSVAAGFQFAVRAGPICEEPVHNILVVLECVEVAVVASASIMPSNIGSSDQPAQEEFQLQSQAPQCFYRASKPLSGGMVVSALRSGIRCALLSRPVRLMEGHLRLTLHSSLTGLGALYSVLSKRRGKVLEDSMVDGTDLLMITVSVPQVEAFGLAPELFGKTSGEVTAPEMVFSHWERLDVDPFWIPTSEEEREDFGELQTAGDTSTGLDNTAIHFIRQVRSRKGLMIDSSRVVASAEKQRTLKR